MITAPSNKNTAVRTFCSPADVPGAMKKRVYIDVRQQQCHSETLQDAHAIRGLLRLLDGEVRVVAGKLGDLVMLSRVCQSNS